MSAEPAISEAFDALAELALALDANPLHKHPGAWVRQIDEQWKVAVNGHKEPVTVDSLEIPPFHAGLWFNGLPAGLMSPYGGIIAAGDVANEDAFIAACRAATARATMPGAEDRDRRFYPGDTT